MDFELWKPSKKLQISSKYIKKAQIMPKEELLKINYMKDIDMLPNDKLYLTLLSTSPYLWWDRKYT